MIDTVMHQLSIAGMTLTVRSTADEAYVRRLAAGVEERVRRAEQQGATSVQAWMLVALGLADELARVRAASTEVRGALIGQLDELAAVLRAEVSGSPSETGRVSAQNSDA